MQGTANIAAAPLGGRIRLLRHSELPQFRDHLLRLDAAGRRDRFNGPTSDAFVAAYAERCFRDGTLVIGYVDGDRVFGAAELHERPEEAEPTGEIAFSVERHLQRQGLGGLLFARLIESARAFGYERLVVTTHPQNEPMKRLARGFNARLRFEEGETVGMIELEPVPPLPARPGAGLFAARAAARA
jgi:RimJ/RimL family protein N-acetyltransferase